MRAIRLDPSGSATELEVETLDDFQSAVSGFIWPVNLGLGDDFRLDVVMFCNESSFTTPELLAENRLATEIVAFSSGEPLTIHGPVLLTGLDRDTGHEISLPADITIEKLEERETWIDKS